MSTVTVTADSLPVTRSPRPARPLAERLAKASLDQCVQQATAYQREAAGLRAQLAEIEARAQHAEECAAACKRSALEKRDAARAALDALDAL